MQEKGQESSGLIADKEEDKHKCECPPVLVLESNPLNQHIAMSLLAKLNVASLVAQDCSTALQLIAERARRPCCGYFPLVLVATRIADRERTQVLNSPQHR